MEDLDTSITPAAPPKLRPHPLGPRDVIDALTTWGRTILTAAAVVLALAGGYRLGQASRHLVLLKQPEATTGVAWSCRGHITVTARLDDLGATPIHISIAGQPAPSGPFTPDASGHVTAYIADMPYAGTVSRIVVAALPVEVGVETREVSVPVLDCGGQ